MEALIRIQKDLKAPKNQLNSFGNYKYRSCEDILEAVKPLLGEAVLLLSDEVVEVGPRIYVKATATLSHMIGGKPMDRSVTAWAREQDSRKGMDAAQVTGSASSYARKYALNGLFLCDDTKDPDHFQPEGKQPDQQSTPPQTPWEPGPAPSTPDTSTPPTTAPPPAANKPPDGKVLAATPDERKWLRMLFDFFVSQASGRQLDQIKLLKLSQMHLARYPNSMNDVEQLKQWIKVDEL